MEEKNIVPKNQSELSIFRSNNLVKRGLELIDSLTPRILYVPTEYDTLEDAINISSDGDYIYILDGHYSVSAHIDKSLSIIGNSDNVTISSKGSTFICSER